MKIEFIEFYPIEMKEGIVNGTLKIRLPDLGIILLGIFVSKRKDRWFFNLPTRQGVDAKSGELIRYPLFAFEDREKQRLLIQAIRTQGSSFVEKRISEIEGQPILKPHEPTKDLPKENVSEAEKKLTEPKKAQIKANDKPTASIASKEWQDPPRRQQTTQRKVCKHYG
jgi:hypothetical protein